MRRCALAVGTPSWRWLTPGIVRFGGAVVRNTQGIVFAGLSAFSGVGREISRLPRRIGRCVFEWMRFRVDAFSSDRECLFVSTHVPFPGRLTVPIFTLSGRSRGS